MLLNDGQITPCFIRLPPFHSVNPRNEEEAEDKRNYNTRKRQQDKKSSCDRAAPGSGIIEKEMKPPRKMTVFSL